jgi:hypothetical protein
LAALAASVSLAGTLIFTKLSRCPPQFIVYEEAFMPRHYYSRRPRAQSLSLKTVYRVAHDLANSLLQENDEVQSMEVRLSQLVAGGAQSTLFEPRRFDLTQRNECPNPLRNALRSVEARFSGTMWRWKLKDEYAPLPEERFSLMPVCEVA